MSTSQSGPDCAGVLTLGVGARVGARRWPRSSEHPGNWGVPWQGRVLDPNDPRAWAQTGAFPVDAPDPKAVEAHVKSIGPSEKVPVLWDFGGFEQVHWETAARLLPYATDYTNWLISRQREFDRNPQQLEAACAIA